MENTKVFNDVSLDLIKAYNDCKNKMQDVDKIIEEYECKTVGDRQKTLELSQLGKFIYSLKDENIEIIEVLHERPDFILKKDNKLIGLEIIEIKDKDIVKPKTTQQLLNKAKDRFQLLYPEIKFYATFSFENEELTISKKNKDELINQICIAAYNCYNGIHVYPKFITNISIIGTKNLEFSHLWVGYVRDLNSTIIEENIKLKEEKIEQYKVNSGIDEQWLLMVIQGGAPNSYDFEFINELEYTSKFDRVYLLEEITIELKRLV